MIHPNSQEFSAVRRHCEEQIEIARNQLERKDISAQETDFIRGRINALREVIALGQPSPIDAAKKFEVPARLGDRSGI